MTADDIDDTPEAHLSLPVSLGRHGKLGPGKIELLVFADNLGPGDAVRVRIAASDVSIARDRHEGSSILNAMPATILGIDPLGEAEASVRLDLGIGAAAPIRARVTGRSLDALALAPGQQVVARIESVSLAANR